MAPDDRDRFLPAPLARAAGEDGEPDDSLPLWAYGGLLDEVFVGRLLEHPVATEVATLLDFELGVFEGSGLPVLRPVPGGRVDGRLYRDLSPRDYGRLDAYQGVGEGLYERVAVRVVATASGSTPEPANLYAPTAKTLGRYSVARPHGRQPM